MKEDSQQYAAAALSGLGPEIADELEPLLAHPNERVRVVSAKLIGITATNSNRFLNALLQMTNDTSVDVRSAAVRSIGFLSNEDAIVPLQALLLDTNLALDAAFSLAEIGGDAVVPVFDLTINTNKIIRTAGWGGLAYFADKERLQTRQTGRWQHDSPRLRSKTDRSQP